MSQLVEVVLLQVMTICASGLILLSAVSAITAQNAEVAEVAEAANLHQQANQAKVHGSEPYLDDDSLDRMIRAPMR